MPTPSFVKRMRRNTGKTVTINDFTSLNKVSRKIIVRDVVYKNGEYYLQGRDVTNIARKGSPTRTIAVSNILRPVSYSV